MKGLIVVIILILGGLVAFVLLNPHGIEGLNPASFMPKENSAGISYEWLSKHGLESEDDGTGDPDNDGFTTMVEFKADTIPVDQSSHPSVVDRLVLWSVEKKAVPVQFMSLTAGVSGETYQINFLDRPKGEQSILVKKGDEIEVPDIGKFRVGDVVKKKKPWKDPTTGEDYMVDASEMTLTNVWITHREEKTTLTQNEASEFALYRATFALERVPHLVPKPATVGPGGVISLGKEKVQIRDVNLAQEFAIAVRLIDGSPSGEPFEVVKPAPPKPEEPAS